MKIKIINILVVFLPLFFSECSIPKRSLSQNENKLVDNLLIFPTYSKIDVIENGDSRVKSENFSEEAEKEIRNQVTKFIPPDLNKEFLECDIKLNAEIINSSIKLIKSLKTAALPKKVKVPEVLLNVLDSFGKSYGLIIVHAGFTRTIDNLKKQYIKRKAVGFATLGFYDVEPNSSFSVMIGVLIDKNQKRILMYKELYWRNRDPNDKFVIRSQIRDIVLSNF